MNKPTNRPTNNRRIETDQWLLTNSTRVFQPITSRLNRPITFNRPDFITSSTDNYSPLDSEDDFRSGCRNVSHQQQFFSELHSPVRSLYSNYWYSWVETIYFNKEELFSKFCLHYYSKECSVSPMKNGEKNDCACNCDQRNIKFLVDFTVLFCFPVHSLVFTQFFFLTLDKTNFIILARILHIRCLSLHGLFW